MAEVIRLKRDGYCDIHVLAERIRCSIGAELSCGEPLCNGNAVMVCFEKYFLRNSSIVSLTVTLSLEIGATKAVIVGAGGGQGVLNMSWGTNKAFADEALDILKAHGFVEYED